MTNKYPKFVNTFQQEKSVGLTHNPLVLHANTPVPNASMNQEKYLINYI